jgi:hypothetical protein
VGKPQLRRIRQLTRRSRHYATDYAT